MEYPQRGNMALGRPLSCSNADIPDENKELVEDKAGAEVGSVRCCNVIGVSLGFTAQVDTTW